MIMVCERCRNEMADNAVICPICGTLKTQASQQMSGGYAPPENAKQHDYYQQNNPRGYQEGYASPLPHPNQQAYPSPPPQPNQQGYQGYAPPQQQNYSYAPPYTGYVTPNINVTVINNGSTGGANDGALIAEILLSLLGIFGVGWLIAGETTTGVILLICSIFLYWPIMFFGTLVTAGIGLLCLGPLMIAAIITNALLLSNAVKRKAARPFVVVPQPPMQQMPPQR